MLLKFKEFQNTLSLFFGNNKNNNIHSQRGGGNPNYLSTTGKQSGDGRGNKPK